MRGSPHLGSVLITWQAAVGGPLEAVARVLRWFGAVLGAAIGKFTLFQRFMLLSLVILVVGAYIIGSYVASEIKTRVIDRTSAITALYVDSFVSPHLQELKTQGVVSAVHLSQLDELLTTTSLGEKIVSFKVWGTDGRVVYASERGLVGQRFPVVGARSKALDGDIQTEVSDLREAENVYERQRWSRLLETYAPLHAQESGEIIGVIEFYQDPTELESEISGSQRKGWLIVGGATGAMYLLLVGMVRGASVTIFRQHRRLELLARENADLADRVRRAAAQKFETDERLMMRLAQDLHDGPAQDVSLALLRLESITGSGPTVVSGPPLDADVHLMRTALSAALEEIRQIAAGLRLPEMEALSLQGVIGKAVQEHQDKTAHRVKLVVPADLPEVELPVKIALYRVTQEALNNAYLHAGVDEEEVELRLAEGALRLEIRDRGVGLEGSMRGSEPRKGRTALGLRGMHERMEMLGGTLEVVSQPGQGTTVRAVVPLSRKGG